MRKTCTKCQYGKELAEFFKDSSKQYGVTSRCKACIAKLNEGKPRQASWKDRMMRKKVLKLAWPELTELIKKELGVKSKQLN